MVSASAFQAEDDSSILFTCSILYNNVINNMERLMIVETCLRVIVLVVLGAVSPQVEISGEW